MCHSGWLWWRVMAGVSMCLCMGWKEAVMLRRWLTLTLCHQYHSARTSHTGSPLNMALFFNVVVIVTVSFKRQTFSNQAVLEMISHAGPEGIRVEAPFVSAEWDACLKSCVLSPNNTALDHWPISCQQQGLLGKEMSRSQDIPICADLCMFVSSYCTWSAGYRKDSMCLHLCFCAHVACMM